MTPLAGLLSGSIRHPRAMASEWLSQLPTDAVGPAIADVIEKAIIAAREEAFRLGWKYGSRRMWPRDNADDDLKHAGIL